MEASNPEQETQELDSRMADRLKVTLWWVKGTMNTYVTVTDYDKQIELTVETPDGVLPHHVYKHPFVYMPADPEAA